MTDIRIIPTAKNALTVSIEGQGPSTAVPRDAIAGRVISVRSGEPVTDAVIRLDPGDRFVHVDSGRFAFPPLP
jgi:hypothetical protein